MASQSVTDFSTLDSSNNTPSASEQQQHPKNNGEQTSALGAVTHEPTAAVKDVQQTLPQTNKWRIFDDEYAARFAKRRKTEQPSQQPVVTYENMEQLPEELKGLEAGYPDFAAIDVQQQFPLSVVHTEDAVGQEKRDIRYRHKDAPTFKVDAFKNAPDISKLRSSVVCLRDSVTGAPVAHFGHLSNRWDPSEFPDGDPRCVQVRLHEDTQRPSVFFRIVLSRHPDGKANRTVTWRCFANSLQRSAEHIGISFGADSDTEVELAVEGLNLVSVQLAAKEKKLWTTTLLLNPRGSKDAEPHGDPIWAGISDLEIDDYANAARLSTRKLSPGEQLVAALSGATSLTTFTEVRETNTPYLRRFFQYMRTIFYLTANLGSHWWYRMRFADIDINDSKYPFSKLDPPRWLVRKWRVTFRNGQPVAALPVAWGGFNYIARYPDPETMAFELRLGIAREALRSSEKFKNLVRSQERLIPFAKFTPNATGSVYIVQIRFEGNHADSLTTWPEFGRKCKLGVTYQWRAIRLTGTVIDDVLPTLSKNTGIRPYQLTVLAIPRELKLPIINYDGFFEISFELTQDRLPRTWALKAVSILQAGQNRTAGVYLPEVVLGAPRPHKCDPATLQQRYKDQTLETYETEIARWNLNAAQLEAARLCIAPDSQGLLNILGNSGTGKTRTLMAIVMALAKTETRVLVTSTMNTSVDKALQAFAKNLSPGFDELLFCRFTGALSRVRTRPDNTPADNEVDDSLETIEEPRAHEIDYQDKPHEYEIITEAFEMVTARLFRNRSSADDPDEQGFAAKKVKFMERVAQGVYTKDTMPVKTAPDPTATSEQIAAANKQYDAALQSWEKNAEEQEAAAKYLQLLYQLREGKLTKSAAWDLRKEFWSLDEWCSQRYLSVVKVVFSTNSSASCEALAEHYKPAVLCQDEASRSTPPEAMIPMAVFKESLRSLIMAGDPDQLTPVVMSMAANESGAALRTAIFAREVDSVNLSTSRYPLVSLTKRYNKKRPQRSR